MGRKFVGTPGTGPTDLVTKGQVVSKSELVFNVYDFGAVSDTTTTATAGTDNRVAIQAALDACLAAGGGTVYFPSGPAGSWYHISAGAPLRIRNNTWIRADPGATIRKPSGTVFAFYVWAAANTGYGSGASDCRVTGLRFYGGYDAGTVITPFVFNNARNIVIESCVFDQVQGSAHTMDIQGSENILIQDCDFIGMAVASTMTHSECIQIDISGVGSSTTPDTVGSYSGLMCKDVTVQRCRFLPVVTGGGATINPCPIPFGSHVMGELKFHENIRFLDNTIIDPAHVLPPTDGDNLNVNYGQVHFGPIKKLTIRGNHFKQTVAGRTTRVIALTNCSTGGLASNDVNLGTGSSGNFTPVTCQDARITDNVFEGFGGSTDQQEIIWLNGISGATAAGGYVGNVVISGNVFKAGWVGVGSDIVRAACIGGRYVDGISIANNEFRSVHVGIHLLSCGQAKVVGNTFRDVGSLASYFPSCTGVTYASNTLTDCGRGVQFHAAAGDVTVTGNVILNPKAGGTAAAGSSWGIAMTNCARGVAMGNTIYNSGTALAGPAINLSGGGASTPLAAIGNMVTGFTTKVTAAATGITNVNNI